MLTKVVAGVITHNNKVYIFKRGKGSFEGLYEFPGGKVEKNESNEQALRRELKEELNIEATIAYKLCAISNDEIMLTTYVINSYLGDIILKEHSDVRLVDQSTIYEYDLVNIDKKIVPKLFGEQYVIFDSIVGHIKVMGNHSNITGISFTDEQIKTSDTPVLLEAEKQLKEYLNKKRESFSLPLYIKGSSFQKEIWYKVKEIDYGETKYYSQLHKGSRAVGNALNQNKHVIVIPCHRVTGKNNIGGYNGGVLKKQLLLKIEGQ